MNRPLKRKIELAVLAWLTNNKTGTVLDELQILSSDGNTWADELQFEQDGTPPVPNTPKPPFLAVVANTSAEGKLPGVFTFEVVLHVKVCGTDPGGEDDEGEVLPASRLDADGILRDSHNILLMPPDLDKVTGDENPEAGAFMAYANKPLTGDDERETPRRPLHFYDLRPTNQPELFEGNQWHCQLIYAGIVQDMDSHDDP